MEADMDENSESTLLEKPETEDVSGDNMEVDKEDTHTDVKHAEEAAENASTEDDVAHTEDDAVDTEGILNAEDNEDGDDDTTEDNFVDKDETDASTLDKDETDASTLDKDETDASTLDKDEMDASTLDKDEADASTLDKNDAESAEEETTDVQKETATTKNGSQASKKRPCEDDKLGEPSEKRAKVLEDGGDSDTLGASSDLGEGKAPASPTATEEEELLREETEESEDRVPSDSVKADPTENTDKVVDSSDKPVKDRPEEPMEEQSETAKSSGDDKERDTDPAVQENKDTKINDAGSSADKTGKKGSVSETVAVNGKVDEEDDSTTKSDDSEKENINTDLPMDLSTKSSAPSDVITLSDDSSDEDGRMNGMSNGILPELTPEELKVRRKLVKKLQSELRNEEAKLVLLKKMRQSQATQQLQDHSNFGSGSSKQAPMRAHAGQPPPLIRGGQANAMPSKPQNSQPVSSHMVRGQPLHHMRGQIQGPPPLVMAPRMSSHLVQPTGLRGGLPPGTAPPNLMPGFRGQLHQQAQAHSQQIAQQQQQQQQQQVDNQTPAQRQAAAKLALRKQLEKTLLQIPPPKPPPPEMNFIPSLLSNEFIMLVGLEEVVNYITDADLIARGEKSPDEKLVCTPFTCVQCDTDFTPVWKREKPGSKNVICEMCVTTNQKKALKQEHTNRLKSAFVKALQQEQEIERMQSQAGAAVTATPTTVAPASTAVNLTAPSYKTSAHAAAAAAEQLRHHQNFLQAHQAHQAHLRASQPMGIPTFNPRSPFHYQIPFKHSDLQRQYLLDMIPSRSLAQSNIGWKS